MEEEEGGEDGAGVWGPRMALIDERGGGVAAEERVGAGLAALGGVAACAEAEERGEGGEEAWAEAWAEARKASKSSSKPGSGPHEVGAPSVESVSSLSRLESENWASDSSAVAEKRCGKGVVVDGVAVVVDGVDDWVDDGVVVDVADGVGVGDVWSA